MKHFYCQKKKKKKLFLIILIRNIIELIKIKLKFLQIKKIY